jgi:hypothetical protein
MVMTTWDAPPFAELHDEILTLYLLQDCIVNNFAAVLNNRYNKKKSSRGLFCGNGMTTCMQPYLSLSYVHLLAQSEAL